MGINRKIYHMMKWDDHDFKTRYRLFKIIVEQGLLELIKNDTPELVKN